MDSNVISLHPQTRTTTLIPETTLAEIRAVLDLQRQGLSYGEIAEKSKIPKSTVALRLRQARQLPSPPEDLFAAVSAVVQQDDCTKESHASADSKPSKARIRKENIRVVPAQEEKTTEGVPCPAAVQSTPCNAVHDRPEIVQNLDCTKEYRPQGGLCTPPVRPMAPVQRESSKAVGAGWAHLGRAALTLFPVVVLTPWLVVSAAQVYAREVGTTWGWLLALGFEGFFLVLATMAPRVAFQAGTPRAFLGSLPRLMKTGFWYAMLMAMTLYSYYLESRTFTPPEAAMASADASF